VARDLIVEVPAEHEKYTGHPPQIFIQATRQLERRIEQRGLAQVSDVDALAAEIDAVLAEHPAEVAAYRGGKEGLIGFFVGQIMRRTRGKANPQLVNELLRSRLAGR
jgi:Asp-tRNA(Asn)/Glu-tRNA(Gln) amidotransferase B subunit